MIALLLAVACGSPGFDRGPDRDGDGWPTSGDCDDAAADVHPGAAELCDGIDQDCDGEADEEALDAVDWYPDADGDGYGDPDGRVEACDSPGTDWVTDDTDCDDGDPSIHPDQPDATNGDTNCDGVRTRF